MGIDYGNSKQERIEKYYIFYDLFTGSMGANIPVS